MAPALRVCPLAGRHACSEEDGVLVSTGETRVDDDVLFGLIDAGRR
jgi:hypothetical protein